MTSLVAILIAMPPRPARAQEAAAGPAADEAEAEADEPSPSRPAPKGKGVVWGTVRSGTSKDTLIEAQVQVVGATKRALSDVDGRYRLELPPGTYELRVFYELHKARRVQNVRVVEGQVAKVDVTLDADTKAVEETVAVEADVSRGTAAGQMLRRKNANTVSDAVSAEDIARTPDRNAADATRRVVGATIVEGRYVVVRGLGERYTNGLLNGAPLPSTEPDRQAVPLDLFPALMISDVTISKTFTPDMPGDFAGGSVNVHTRDMVPKLELQATASLGANTQTTFGKRLTYEGGSLDWLGIDDGKRKLPTDIPADRVTRIDRNGNVDPNLDSYGKSINGPMNATRTTSLPNGALNVVAGDTLHFGSDKGQALGWQVAGGYTRRFTRRANETIRTFTVDSAPNAPAGSLRRLNDYTAETGTDQVAWNGLGSVSWAPNKNHTVTLTGLYSRSSDNETRAINGFNDERASDISDTRLRFISRQLAFGQLRGEHTFPKATTGTLGWNLLLSRATSDEPNTRETIYGADPTVGSTWLEATLSGSHFYARQHEVTHGGAIDWTQPLGAKDSKTPRSIKVGGLVNRKHRYFEARRFRFVRSGGADLSIYQRPPEQLFTDDNVGPALTLDEYTRANDAYIADHDVYAAYVMGDIALTPRVKFVVGERVEASRQTIDSFDPLAAELATAQARLHRTDLLPAASLVYKVTDASNLRASVSRTVARPQLRELAPFAFTDYFGAREIQGNPNLDRTSITNADLRWEWFPTAKGGSSGSEVLAVTLFGKSFDKPIEQIIIPTSQGVVSFQNARGATNLGVELEARKGLGFLSSNLSELSVLGNLTLVHSRVRLDGGPGQVQTNSRRPLAQQSPYVVNAALDWNHEKTKTRIRVLYNVFGERIAQVGQYGLPDVYEQPRHQIDASVAQALGSHTDLKLTVENLLDTPVRFTQGTDGAFVVNRYRVGATYWASVTVTY